MTTIDHTAEAKAVAEKINALGGTLPHEALQCARNTDLAGLVYIANIARDLPGNCAMNMGAALDLADYLQGTFPRLVQGRGTAKVQP